MLFILSHHSFPLCALSCIKQINQYMAAEIMAQRASSYEPVMPGSRAVLRTHAKVATLDGGCTAWNLLALGFQHLLANWTRAEISYSQKPSFYVYTLDDGDSKVETVPPSYSSEPAQDDNESALFRKICADMEASIIKYRKLPPPSLLLR